MKQPIDPLRYAGEIMTALQSGVLLTTQSGGRLNTMTISWGTLGVEWGVPIFTAFVREGAIPGSCWTNPGNSPSAFPTARSTGGSSASAVPNPGAILTNSSPWA